MLNSDLKIDTFIKMVVLGYKYRHFVTVNGCFVTLRDDKYANQKG
jgi:hypothetical protein